MSVLIDAVRRGDRHRTTHARRGHLRVVRSAGGDVSPPSPAAPVRGSTRVLRDEPRRPPTRGRVVAGRRRARPASCPGRMEARRWGWLAGLAAAVCAAVIGLGAFGSEMAGAAAVPDRTVLVPVGEGETLWEVASRYAPDSEPAEVVRRIEELNQLAAADVLPGMALAVPAQPGALPG